MGLWTSFKNLFRSGVEKVDDAISDDVRDGKYAIIDSKRQIADFRKKIARFVAANKGVERDLAAALNEVDKWKNIKSAAEARENETDVATANGEIANAQRLAIGLKKQQELNLAAIDKLRDQLDSAERKVDRAESDHAQLAARKEGAEIRKDLAAASSQFGESNSPLSALDDLRDSVETAEDEADAFEELSTTAAQSLEDKYAVTDTNLDSQFDELFKS